ncbi:MAG: type II toxin-antitoxin system VapC family toxin [Fimbriimonadia bacterium]|nr:type II toxin-antitoxin system VapC family toxin [Fimbriimonadia bacterium]
MRVPRVYADTSIFGGYFDQEFEIPTRRFFEQVRCGHFLLVSSRLVQLEIVPAPLQVRDLFDEMLPNMHLVEISEDAQQLQQFYLKAGIVTHAAFNDALHVATASTSGCSMIVSWNFKHIVHYQRIPQYNLVNVQQGYTQIAIFSPLEVIGDEDESV